MEEPGFGAMGSCLTVYICCGNDCVGFAGPVTEMAILQCRMGRILILRKKTLAHPLIFEFFPYLCRPKK